MEELKINTDLISEELFNKYKAWIIEQKITVEEFKKYSSVSFIDFLCCNGLYESACKFGVLYMQKTS